MNITLSIMALDTVMLSVTNRLVLNAIMSSVMAPSVVSSCIEIKIRLDTYVAEMLTIWDYDEIL